MFLGFKIFLRFHEKPSSVNMNIGNIFFRLQDFNILGDVPSSVSIRTALGQVRRQAACKCKPHK